MLLSHSWRVSLEPLSSCWQHHVCTQCLIALAEFVVELSTLYCNIKRTLQTLLRQSFSGLPFSLSELYTYSLYIHMWQCSVNCVRAGVYGRCVYKFDHYCVWIGNCVGGLNHRYFVALLLSLSLMCLHGVHGVFNVFTALLTVRHQLTTPYHSVKVHTSHTVTVCKAC